MVEPTEERLTDGEVAELAARQLKDLVLSILGNLSRLGMEPDPKMRHHQRKILKGMLPRLRQEFLSTQQALLHITQGV